MTTLTTAQINYIRHNSGDSEVPYEIDEDILQELYDDSDQGNSVLNDTVYYVILRRLGLAVAGVAISSPETGGMNTALNQKFEQLERLLKTWGDITGLGGQGLRAGVITLGIDEVADDV